MANYNVLKTVYLNNGSDEFFRYEIIGEHESSILFAMAFAEVRITQDGLSYSVWSKIDNITFDHLEPSSGGFQTEVRSAPYPGKSFSTVIDECQKHRAQWNK